MQRDEFNWVFAGIALVILIGLGVLLRQRDDSEQPPALATYQPSALPIPANVLPVSLRGDAASYAFSNDERRVYFARCNGAVIELCEYNIASKTEKTLARFQVPSGQNVDSIRMGKDGQVVALLTSDSEPQSIRPRTVVISRRGRAKTITYRLLENCSIKAIAENGAAIAGYYTRIVHRDPLSRINTVPISKIIWTEKHDSVIFEPKQYQIPAPHLERAIPNDFRLSEPYTTDNFTKTMHMPEKFGNEVNRRPNYPVVRHYAPQIRHFPDFPAGGGDPSSLTTVNPFTVTEQYIFCSVRGRMRSTKVYWDGDNVVIGVNASGNRVAGNYSHQNRHYGFIWRVGIGMRTLRYPGSQHTQLCWLSPQGDAVLGLAAISDTKTLLFRWSRRNGYKRLGEIPESMEGLSISCIAPNGQAVLLKPSSYSSERIYFVWSEHLGFCKNERLGDILIKPLCISNSGKLILAETQWGVAFVKVE